MNYEIIKDEAAINQFITWLPDLKPDETFYMCLFARSKYCKGIAHVRSDKAQLKRFTTNKERMLLKIKQLECAVGSYAMKEVGTSNYIPVPQEALSLYISINPRSFIKATTHSVKKLLDLALQPYNGYHPYQEVMSEVQKAKSRTEFITFDFDMENKACFWSNVYPYHIEPVINKYCLQIIETRGGFHVIVRVKDIAADKQKNWYQSMRKILALFSADHDNAGDIMLPVPGTYQGGFVPRIAYANMS